MNFGFLVLDKEARMAHIRERWKNIQNTHNRALQAFEDQRTALATIEENMEALKNEFQEAYGEPIE